MDAGVGQFLFVGVWLTGGVALLVWWFYERSKAKKKRE